MEGRMEGGRERRTDGGMDERRDGRTDGGTHERKERRTLPILESLSPYRPPFAMWVLEKLSGCFPLSPILSVNILCKHRL